MAKQDPYAGNIQLPVPSLYGGISQQPAHVRHVNQVEDATNAAFDVFDGVSKRPGTEYVIAIPELPAGEFIPTAPSSSSPASTSESAASESAASESASSESASSESASSESAASESASSGDCVAVPQGCVPGDHVSTYQMDVTIQPLIDGVADGSPCVITMSLVRINNTCIWTKTFSQDALGDCYLQIAHVGLFTTGSFGATAWVWQVELLPSHPTLTNQRAKALMLCGATPVGTDYDQETPVTTGYTYEITSVEVS